MTFDGSIEGRESRSRLGLETKGIEPLGLGLVLNFGTCLLSVSPQMKIFGTVLSRSRLVCFNFTQSCPDLAV